MKKIKFVTRSNLSDHVSPENQLAAWGGLDPWTYIWEPEAKKVNLLEASDQEWWSYKFIQNKVFDKIYPFPVRESHKWDKRFDWLVYNDCYQ